LQELPPPPRKNGSTPGVERHHGSQRSRGGPELSDRNLCRCTAVGGCRSLGLVRRSIGSAVIIRGLAGELALAFLFLLALFRQVSLTLFERIVWFGQDIAFACREPACPLSGRAGRRGQMPIRIACRRGRSRLRRHPLHRRSGHAHHRNRRRYAAPADGLH
jgi:hypothetical protein